MTYPIRPDGAPDAEGMATQIDDQLDTTRRVADRILAAGAQVPFSDVREFVFHCRRTRELMDAVGSAGNVANVAGALALKITNRTNTTVTATQAQTAAQSVYGPCGNFIAWAVANYPKDASGNVLDTQLNADGTFTLKTLNGAAVTALKNQVQLVRNAYV